MKKTVSIIIIILTVSVLLVGCKPVRSEPPQDIARELMNQLVSGDFEEAFNSFDTTMKSTLPQDVLKEAWQSLIQQAGPYSHELEYSEETGGKFTRVTLTSQFAKMPLNVVVTLNGRKEVAGLLFAPAQGYGYTPPKYAAPSMYIEEAVTITSGSIQLGGTLTVPEGAGPWPAVVLVHGSGPNDRDETIGGNKPFADIAWGLASRGIAVLRYDKRTLVYAQQMAARTDITLWDKSVDDALAAVNLLKEDARISQSQIYVLGHSIGGMAAPRLGEAVPALAGLILLAAPARPLEDLVLEQYTYLLSLEENASQGEATLRTIEQQVARVKSLNENDVYPASELLGFPASFWLDVQDYDQAELASQLPMPLLVLQGGRDYQVTMQDFNLWQQALSGKPNATLISYPDLNHLFMVGAGKSTPSEYFQSDNIDSRVISDMVDWIKR